MTLHKTNTLSHILKRKKYAPVISLVLVFVLMFTVACGNGEKNGNDGSVKEPEITEKPAQGLFPPAQLSENSEVIYAKLDANGKQGSMYGVVHLNVSSPGGITEYGSFSDVIGLDTTEAISLSNNSPSPEGHAFFNADKGDVYIQADMEGYELPWSVDVTYTLDGNEISPDELAGKSGALEIEINTAKNASVDPVYFDNYVMQISIPLDSLKASNVVAEGAQIAESGGSRTVSFTGLPGKDGLYSLTADISDFEMDGIQIAAVPFAMMFDIPDTDNLTDEFETLADAIDALEDGSKLLANGADKLADGTPELTSGSKDFYKALKTLAKNAKTLSSASKKIDSSLSHIASSLDTEDGEGSDLDLSKLAALPASLRKLAETADVIKKGIESASTGLVDIQKTLSAVANGVPNINESDIERLLQNASAAGLSPDDLDVLNQLVMAYSAAQMFAGVWNGQSSDGVDVALTQTIGGLDQLEIAADQVSKALSTMASSIETLLSTVDENMFDQLEELATGLSRLSAEYTSFNSGLKEFSDGLNKASSSYSIFDSGLGSLGSGVIELASGADDLWEGLAQIADGTADIPDRVKEEIDSMLSSFDTSDYKPVSFLSPSNKNVSLVQFVIKTDSVLMPEKESTSNKTEKKSTFFGRIKALFD